MASSKVHRRLYEHGKIERGADVIELQKAINDRLRARDINPHQVAVDGEYGPKTHAGALRALYYLGVTRHSVGMPTKNPGTLTWRAQTMIRSPKRNRWQKARGAARVKAFLKSKTQGPDAAIREARKYVGQTESPSGSNKGPGIISKCQITWLGWAGYSWCGAFSGWCLKAAGVKGLVGKNIVYTPSIVNDARAGRNGFRSWTTSMGAARKGDLVLFNWDGGVVDHVGIFTGKRYSDGSIETIEGNTSSSNVGSQSNGGGVFVRRRYDSQIEGFARPRW